MSVHFFVIAGDFWHASVLVDNGNASFAGAMQAFLGVLYAGMDAGQALADLGNISKASGACHDMFALMDRKSLVNGLVTAGDMPMSLLAYSAWTSPNVWTRTTPCSATLSAMPSSLASEVPAKQVWRWSVPPRQNGIAASAVPLIPKNEGQNCREDSNSKGVLASHTLHRNRWSSTSSVEVGGSPVRTCRAARRLTYDSATITCSTVVPYRCQKSRSPVCQQLPRSRLRWVTPGIVVE